ncbi:MAG: TolC family protein [Pseudomonadota bacterium]
MTKYSLAALLWSVIVVSPAAAQTPLALTLEQDPETEYLEEIREPSNPNALGLIELLDRSSNSVPKILEAREKINSQRAKALAAEGAFDRQLSSLSRSRAAGFYGLTFIDNKLATPLRNIGGEVYGGYRISDGDFPVYEDEYVTLGFGELNFGASIALLRDRQIDGRRMTLRDRAIEIEMAELDYVLASIEVQHDAMIAYWNWVAAGQQLIIFKDLQDLATNRTGALSTRIQEGDLADIELVENQQRVFSRRERVIRAEQVLNNAALALSFYFRDEAGEPIVPGRELLPSGFPAPETESRNLTSDVGAALDRQVELALIDRRLELASNRRALGRNELLPQVDLEMKVARDFGGGSVTRDETDLFVGFEVSVPLERRKAKGEIAAAEADIRALEQRRKNISDQLIARIGQLANTIEAAQTSARLASGELRLAERLEAAERLRFREGASSFFLLNQREDARAEARLKQVNALALYQRAVTDYLAITADTTALRVRL